MLLDQKKKIYIPIYKVNFLSILLELDLINKITRVFTEYELLY